MLRWLEGIQPCLKRLRNDPERQWRPPFGGQRKRLAKLRPSPFSGGFRVLATLRLCVRLALSLIGAISTDERCLGPVLQRIMIWRLQLWRLLGALAVLAVLSLAPQAASAHAGHSHGHHGGAAQVVSPPSTHDVTIPDQPTQISRAEAPQELSAVGTAAPDSDETDGGQGCCCSACHGFFAVFVPATTPPSLSSILHLRDPLAQLGAGSARLRRPPKSFV
jgi:hypothetical protein